ncbi:MAG: hypothetical protein HYX33_02605 [Actinobacteria bacterium]|nr:hypothetical protein [Actinomycetota bacterium]
MDARHLVLVAATALAVPATSLAHSNRHQLDATLTTGQQVSLTIDNVAPGEFAFMLRASSDDQKNVKVTQRRIGGSSLTVIDTSAPTSANRCQGAAGTLVCTNITTPAAPGNRSWKFTVKSTGPRPTSITLVITSRRVAHAG